MKRFLFLIFLLLIALLLGSCNKRSAPVGSDPTPSGTGIVIIHDEQEEQIEKQIEQPEAPPAEHTHTFGDLIPEVPATCTEAGTKAYLHCEICGKDFDADECEISELDIPALGHTPGEWLTDAAPTCTEEGSKHRICLVCGAVAETGTIPAKGHVEVIDQAIPATCLQVGRTEGKHCAICGRVLAGSVQIEKSAHAFGEWIDEIPSTCKSTGTLGHFVCSVCLGNFDEDGIELNDLTIPCKAHRYENRVCKVCGEYKPSANLAFRSNGDGTCILLSQGSCTDFEIVVPSVSPGGDRVVGISENAFMNSFCENIRLPASIAQIAHFAISNCTDLTEIFFSGTVEEWSAIEKDEHWINGTGITIRCSNGTLEI